MVIKYSHALDSGEEPFKIFSGRLIHSKSLKHLEILPHASLGVKPDGTIAFIDVKSTPVQVLEAKCRAMGYVNVATTTLKKSQFLFPGLIDTHLHAPQWPNLALGMEGDLREWCEEFTDPIEASYSDNDKARRVYDDVTKTTLKMGSTTVAYNSSKHPEATNILADAALRNGQRAIIGKMCITVGSTHGNWEASTEESLAASQASIDHIRKIDPTARLISPCVMPRGGPFAPPDLMAGLGEQYHAHPGIYFQGHMCETHGDIATALALHKKYTTYTDLYAAYKLLDRKSIMAHCIHLTDHDIDMLKRTGAGVAHNPNSNTCLRDGVCRVRELLDAGVKVGLGTDCSAGYMPSIHDAMRNASNVSRHLAMTKGDDRVVLGFTEIVYLATMGGARVVDMEDKIGSFAVGKVFDALVVDVEGVASANSALWEDGEGDGEAMVKKWVFLGDDRTIRKVFVQGKLVAGHDLDA